MLWLFMQIIPKDPLILTLIHWHVPWIEPYLGKASFIPFLRPVDKKDEDRQTLPCPVYVPILDSARYGQGALPRSA
jgi:hypothetical protein